MKFSEILGIVGAAPQNQNQNHGQNIVGRKGMTSSSSVSVSGASSSGRRLVGGRRKYEPSGATTFGHSDMELVRLGGYVSDSKLTSDRAVGFRKTRRHSQIEDDDTYSNCTEEEN